MYSSQVIVETLKRILDLDYLPEAKCVLLGMLISNKTIIHIQDLVNVINAPLVDIDFGRSALTAERATKGNAFDFVNLSERWMEQYVPEWFEAAIAGKQVESDRKESDSKSRPPKV